MSSNASLISRLIQPGGNLISAEGTISTAGGTSTYATIDDLPLSENEAGDQAFVESNDRLYIWTGDGWYNIALINTAPSITQGGDGLYVLAIDGTPTVITLVAEDPEGIPITWSYSVTSGSLGNTATVTQADNVFTITPSTNTDDQGEFTITFTASDGVNIATDVNSFSLSFLSPFWNETALSIATSSTNGSQNNTFLDSSSNGHTITRNGNVTQGSFSPFSVDDGKWGNYFDGVDDYLSVSNSGGDFSVTSSFSVEAWFYMTVAPSNATTGAHCIVSHWDGATDPRAWFIDTGNNLDFRVFVYDSGGNSLVSQTGVGSFSLNQWTHVALTWDGSNYRFFVDGSLIFTVASSTAPNPATSKNIIIGYNANTQYFPGYISNVRITVDNGALYTSAFTPPITPLTAVSGTSLLTCQSNRFVDNSGNDQSITIAGNPKVVPFSPFPLTTAYDASTNGGSGYFDGSGDYLTAAANADFQFGTGDFTVQAWIYPMSNSASSHIFSHDGASGGTWYLSRGTDGRIDSWIYGDPVNSGTAGKVPLYAWTHVLVSRSGGVHRSFINGVVDKSYSTSSNISKSTFNINRLFNGAVGAECYLSDIRIEKSVGVTSATVPTAPLTTTGSESFLGNFTNASIYDATGKNVLETVGNAATSTAQTKYADTSMYFDGTGDYLQWNSATQGFGTGNYTVEFWLNLNSLASINGVFQHGQDNGAFAIHVNTNGTVRVLENSVSSLVDSSVSLSTGTWYHVAVVQDGTNGVLYIDGTNRGTFTKSTSWTFTNETSYIGARYFSGNAGQYPLNGYIENLQILKGVAKYTTNFTPPNRTQSITYQAES